MLGLFTIQEGLVEFGCQDGKGWDAGGVSFGQVGRLGDGFDGDFIFQNAIYLELKIFRDRLQL